MEAADGVLALHVQLEDDGASLGQAAETALLELGDLVAQLGVPDAGQGHRHLHLNAQLDVDVGQGEGAESVLGRKLDAQAGGEARRLEVMAVVDGVVLEHDGDLHREADLHLGGCAVAVLGVLEAVVLPGAAHEVLHLVQIVGLAGAHKVRQGLHSAVGLLEALLELFARRFFLGRGRGIVVFGFCAGSDPSVSLLFLLLRDVSVGLVSLVILHDGMNYLGPRLSVFAVAGRHVCDGFPVLGGDRLIDRTVTVLMGFSCTAVGRGFGRFRAGVVGILILVDGNADGEAHLVAVHDEGGVIAQLQLQARQLGAQVRAEFGIAHVVARGAAFGAAGVPAGGQVHHAVGAGRRGHGTHGDGLRLDVALGQSSQRFQLRLNAQHEGAASGHGAQEGVHGVQAAVVNYIAVFVTLKISETILFAVVGHVLSGHRNGMPGDVVGIDHRRRLVEVDQQIAHELRRPGIGLFGLRPGDLSVLIPDRRRLGFIEHAARIAAQGDIHVAQRGGVSSVHQVSVRVRSLQVAVALLLRRQGGEGRLVRHGAGQGREDLRMIGSAGALGDLVGPGAQGVEDLHVILMGLSVRVCDDRLEGRFRVVALESGGDQLVLVLPGRVCVQEEHAV